MLIYFFRSRLQLSIDHFHKSVFFFEISVFVPHQASQGLTIQITIA